MLRDWIWLSLRKHVEKARKIELLEHFGSVEALYHAGPAELALVPELRPQEREALLDKSQAEAEEILCQCFDLDIGVLCWQDAQYPGCLRNISDPPVVLYYKGRLPDFDASVCLGVVGARRASAFGLLTAKRMGYQLARGGAIVISGLADGVDAMAMTGALMAGGCVVGVLGCGADVIYPPKNKALYADTLQRGCILTEYPPHTPPIGFHFPVRNRILSGLSDGVVVVEAAAKSGALITARLALEQGRDVFAVPGNAGSEACAGSNRLLREGAIFAENGADVLQEYAGRYPQLVQGTQIVPLELSEQDLRRNAAPKTEKKTARVANSVQDVEKYIDNGENPAYIDCDKIKQGLSPDQCAIVDLLAQGPQNADDIVDALQLPAQRVTTALTLLEIRGVVCKQGTNRYGLQKK